MDLIAFHRVSTGRQVDGLGLDIQAKAIRAFARGGGHKIRASFTEVTDSANDLADRPELGAAFKALADLPEGSALVVYRYDRLARKLVNQETWIERIEQTGRQVISATEPLSGDDEMRVLIRQILGAVGAYEKAVIRKRMQSGRQAKAERGGFAYGSPAFGQQSVNGQLTADEAEAAVTARMRGLRDDGLSYRQIAAQLNTEGLAAKRGGEWHSQTVARVLSRL